MEAGAEGFDEAGERRRRRRGCGGEHGGAATPPKSIGGRRRRSPGKLEMLANVPALRRARSTKKLVLRATASLDSKKSGSLPAGITVIVLEEVVDEASGVTRVRVGLDSSPRGVAFERVGWCTAEKDGEMKLTFLTGTERADHPPSPTMRHVGALTASPAPNSMAARIARRRQEAAQEREDSRTNRATGRSPTPSLEEGDPMEDEGDADALPGE